MTQLRSFRFIWEILVALAQLPSTFSDRLTDNLWAIGHGFTPPHRNRVTKFLHTNAVKEK